MPTNQMSFQVEEPSRSAPAGGAPPGPEKWKIAAGGGLVLVLVIVVVAVVLSGGGKKDAGPGDGGGDTDGGDDVIVDPVGPPAEQIIWAYHDGELSPYQQLCRETIEQHKGGFDFKLLSKDDVTQHISKDDLPKDWESLKPRYKRDAAINALLARHGGVALDINTIMFRSFDEWWDQDVRGHDVAFRGFHYRSRAETATWFMMVGDKGTSMMQTAVERQKNMSGNDPAGCMEKDRDAELCYGSSVVSYALCTYRSVYCRCYEDEVEGCELLKIKSKDADVLYDLTDPRNTVQSELKKDKIPKEDKWQPMDSTDEEGEEEEEFANFKTRFNDELLFISLQAPTSRTDQMAGMTRVELLAAESTFFYKWLCLAKHTATDEAVCGE